MTKKLLISLGLLSMSILPMATLIINNEIQRSDVSDVSESVTDTETSNTRIFEGWSLDRDAIYFLGWETKTVITLEDWKNAPNIVEIGNENSTHHSAPFFNHSFLEKIEIPKRIKKIGTYAFGFSDRITKLGPLKEVIFENGSQLEFIGFFSFEHASLTSIIIPDSVTHIRSLAFDDNTLLTNITMPPRLRGAALYTPEYGLTQQQWDNIDWLHLGKMLTLNEVISLGWDKKKRITLQDWRDDAPNVAWIGESDNSKNTPFEGNKILEFIVIPHHIESIGFGAFLYADKLQGVEFQRNSQLKEISKYAFEGTAITSINIPHTVNSINYGAFANIHSLNGSQVSMSGKLNGNSVTALYGFTQQQWDNINWTPFRFEGTTLTKGSVISNGWAKKSNISLADWRDWAPNINQVGEQNLDIENSPFANNKILKSISLPSTVTLIGNNAFIGSSVSSINFENSGLLTIGNNAFENSDLLDINIPDTVTSIGNNAFKDTWSLQGRSISMSSNLRRNSSTPLYGFTQQQWDNINWKPVKFEGLTLTKEDVTNLGWRNKENITLQDWKTWAPNVTEIGSINTQPQDSPFFENKFITSIEIPASVKMLGSFSFNNASNLRTIVFEQNSQLLSIENNAFSSSGITSIEIPASVKMLGSFSFNNASNLETIVFEQNSQLLSIENNAFSSSGITSIDLPRNLTSIGNSAFSSTKSLNSITMSYNLTQNSIETKYGFTQEQWDNITLIDTPTSGIIDKIVARELLKISSDINWGTFSKYEGISRNAFENSKITSIEIQSEPQYFLIENGAFSNTTSLINIKIDASHKSFIEADRYGFSKEQKEMIKYTNEIIIPPDPGPGPDPDPDPNPDPGPVPNPDPGPGTNPNPEVAGSNNVGLIVGLTLGIVGIIAVGFGGYFLWKRNPKNEDGLLINNNLTFSGNGYEYQEYQDYQEYEDYQEYQDYEDYQE
ncbi:MAG: leucine-rich repeat protein [Metamycoplasmataceae bacterium]